jgi:hypothetical protein
MAVVGDSLNRRTLVEVEICLSWRNDSRAALRGAFVASKIGTKLIDRELGDEEDADSLYKRLPDGLCFFISIQVPSVDGMRPTFCPPSPCCCPPAALPAR